MKYKCHDVWQVARLFASKYSLNIKDASLIYIQLRTKSLNRRLVNNLTGTGEVSFQVKYLTVFFFCQTLQRFNNYLYVPIELKQR